MLMFIIIWYGRMMRQKSAPSKGEGNHNGKRLPGRPRSEQARVAILRTTLKLLEKNGFSGLNIEDIAKRAGVGKATVYRWWPHKGALIADAFAHTATHKLHFPDTGSLRTDISRQMRQLIKIFAGREGRIVSAILAAGQTDHDLIAAFRERFMKPRRREAYATLQRGVRRGELRRNVDPDLLLDSLYGPIYMRFLIRHDRLTPDFVNRLSAMVLSAARPRQRARSKPSRAT
jgi:AcrR family transcriptional regulator